MDLAFDTLCRECNHGKSYHLSTGRCARSGCNCLHFSVTAVAEIPSDETGLEAAEFLLSRVSDLMHGRSIGMTATTLHNAVDLWLAQRGMLKDKDFQFILCPNGSRHVFDSDVEIGLHNPTFGSSTIYLTCSCGQRRYY
jgi:hypothetical protein